MMHPPKLDNHACNLLIRACTRARCVPQGCGLRICARRAGAKAATWLSGRQGRNPQRLWPRPVAGKEAAVPQSQAAYHLFCAKGLCHVVLFRHPKSCNLQSLADSRFSVFIFVSHSYLSCPHVPDFFIRNEWVIDRVLLRDSRSVLFIVGFSFTSEPHDEVNPVLEHSLTM